MIDELHRWPDRPERTHYLVAGTTYYEEDVATWDRFRLDGLQNAWSYTCHQAGRIVPMRQGRRSV